MLGFLDHKQVDIFLRPIAPLSRAFLVAEVRERLAILVDGLVVLAVRSSVRMLSSIMRVCMASV